MSPTVAGIFGDYLKEGLAVAVQRRSDEQVAAIVEDISVDSIRLKLQSRSSEPSFTQRDEVRISYWDEGSTIYSWVGSVLEVHPKDCPPVVSHIYAKIQDFDIAERSQRAGLRAGRYPSFFQVAVEYTLR